ncbi:peptide ABC transporter substrate-binding protein [Mammaliicoccus sp. Dog046]|uniref:peptide ABC transporter substrate-binding protein n=1 Tax=Mammaliicoccus sp. Dog046 TaxID=3034233 RepID=UPI002B25B599|nr:peptide ABC transporter substrate-binding protein [Mammaliicoccus sp. Dog046]WQK84837.1 peptide ABC transporter substrate-binding protein [Mammaliicoccus sp. Dog046]
MNKKYLRWQVLVLLSLVLVLSACSGGGKDNSSSSAGDGKKLRLISISDIPSMDSTLATDAVSFDTLNNTMEGLYKLDKNDKAIPGIAKSDPEKSDDGLTWTIKLRDAKWSNGDDVTAQDFVYAWRKLVDPKTASEYAFIMFDIKNAEDINNGKKKPSELGVKAIDDHTLEIKLNRELPYYQELLTFGSFLPQNEKFAKDKGEKYGTTAKDTLYNGPFTLSSWKTEDRYTLIKNKHYWDKGNVKLDAVNYKVVKEPQTALNMYNADDVDETLIPAENVNKYKKDKAYNTELEARVYFMRLNQKDVPEFKNKDLRMAIAQSIDKDQYVKSNLNNGSKAANTLVPTEFVKDTKGEDYVKGVKSENKFDKKAAKKHLEAAKKSLGKDKFTFELLTYDQDNAKKDAEYFKEQIEQNLPGVTIKVKQQPYKQKLKLEEKMDYQISFGRWGPDYPDAMTFLELFTSDNVMNETGWKNKEYDKKINEAGHALLNKEQERISTMQDAESLLLDEAVVVPIYQQGNARLTQDYVKGIERHQFGGDTDLKHASVQK